jgi:lysophospholipid acyltransferase (LPLAT)-like uncharacterized protein
VSLTRGKRLKAAAIAAVATPVVEALGATYAWRECGAHHLTHAGRDGRQPILALWHGRILAGMLYFRDRGLVAIASENFDGEWISRLLQRFGFGTARGSSSRGGVRALVQLRRDLAAGRPVVFTVDGPRGPARVAQPGALWLAGATRNPIVPFHVEARSFWTVNSWDRHQIPKPGTDLAIAIGEPIHVLGTDEEIIERARLTLERDLTRLETDAKRLLISDTP